MSSLVNVTVWAPGKTVPTMQDELDDGNVQRAVDAAIAAYLPIDSDGSVPVMYYDSDFDNAVVAATDYAKGTKGRDLLVIISDLVCGQPRVVEQRFAQLSSTDDLVIVVPVSNQGHNEKWAKQLDDEGPGAANVDVITVEGLADRTTAYAEVDPWLNKA